MYRLSLLPNKSLISTDEVVALSPVDNEIDPRLILPAIQIAEERFIRQAICKDLYNDFRNKKNVIVTEINLEYIQSLMDEGAVIRIGDIVNAIEFVDNAFYKELWNEYLWKLTAECVIYIAMPTNYSRFTSQGEMINNPRTMGIDAQGSATVSLNDLKWKMDKFLMDRIDPLIASTQEYLCDNIEKFPLYNCRKCCDENGVSFQRKTPWIHNIYEDEVCDSCND